MSKEVEEYARALDDYLCDPEDDDRSCQLADAAQELKKAAPEVSADANFNGRIITVTGKVCEVLGDKVYIESEVLGGVVECFGETVC